jgi:hypothetical protein
MPFESSPKTFAEVRVPGVRFVGEQNGRPERLLKDRLVELFRQDKTLSAAYLARVDLGNGSIGVVLALRATSGPNKQIIEKVGSIFALIFAGKEHLDILFLSETQETQLKQVCKAFFSQAG